MFFEKSESKSFCMIFFLFSKKVGQKMNRVYPVWLVFLIDNFCPIIMLEEVTFKQVKIGPSLRVWWGGDVLVLRKHPNCKPRLLTNIPKLPQKVYNGILENFVPRLKASKHSYLTNSDGVLKDWPSQVEILSEKKLYRKTTAKEIECSSGLSREYCDSVEGLWQKLFNFEKFLAVFFSFVYFNEDANCSLKNP